jgi:hypothetical protein
MDILINGVIGLGLLPGWDAQTVVRQGLTDLELNTLNGMFSKLLTRLMAELVRIGDSQTPGERF